MGRQRRRRPARVGAVHGVGAVAGALRRAAPPSAAAPGGRAPPAGRVHRQLTRLLAHWAGHVAGRRALQNDGDYGRVTRTTERLDDVVVAEEALILKVSRRPPAQLIK